MNQHSEQITPDLNIVTAPDQPLSPSELRVTIANCIGEDAKVADVEGKKVVLYEHDGIRTVILSKAVTYLGNPHPTFKKRIQIPGKWIEYARTLISKGYDVRFIGVYNYNGMVVFVDFEKDTYLSRNCNNSAAHVYVNDLYQGATMGLFKKTDSGGNRICTVSRHFFRQYLNGQTTGNPLLNLFADFNSNFIFGKTLTAKEAITEMQQRQWSQWRQAEWPGWFLEYRFHAFTQNKEVAPFIQYTALSNKKADNINIFDFDLFFPEQSFYGDLKASDISKQQSPGNDQEAFVSCINRYGKFWYVIFEHHTEKDKDHNFEATIFRNRFLRSIDNVAEEDYDEMSYSSRMKHSVVFRRMYILELNRINFHNLLADFNQGHQPGGAKRAKKFLIDKRNIDNFLIYRYEWQ